MNGQIHAHIGNLKGRRKTKLGNRVNRQNDKVRRRAEMHFVFILEH